MSKEIERKFKVINDSYSAMATKAYSISQCYLSTSKGATVRIRIKDDRAYLTVKSVSKGATRDEWEYMIPVDDALEMMSRCDVSGMIEKRRFIVPYDGHLWEVDKFGGSLNGLVIAEIELDEENSEFALPPFIGNEVTGDPRYFNSNLVELSGPEGLA